MRTVSRGSGTMAAGMRRGIPGAAILALLLTLPTAPARSKVTRFEILSREAEALGERAFDARGAAEKITARATIALDPADPRNAVIADIDHAPRNAEGRVVTITEVVILQPGRPNGTLLFAVLNRRRKLLPGRAQDTDAAASIRLARPEDAGNGFLLERGHTLVWAGRQIEAPAGPDLPQITVPTIVGFTGPSREEFAFEDAATPRRVAFSYPAADRACSSRPAPISALIPSANGQTSPSPAPRRVLSRCSPSLPF